MIYEKDNNKKGQYKKYNNLFILRVQQCHLYSCICIYIERVCVCERERERERERSESERKRGWCKCDFVNSNHLIMHYILKYIAPINWVKLTLYIYIYIYIYNVSLTQLIYIYIYIYILKFKKRSQKKVLSIDRESSILPKII